MLMRKLENSKMEDGQDPDVFFVQIDQLADGLQSMGDSVTKNRVMDIILSGMTTEYELSNFKMTDSEFLLANLKFTMRNMYMNGLQTPRRKGRGSALTADAARRDKSGLKCHSCGKMDIFKGNAWRIRRFHKH